MLDINQSIAADLAGTGKACTLDELEEWSEDIARQNAKADGIELTPEHWEVICYLRDHYEECGPSPSGRILLHCMEKEFAPRGGRKFLFRLFPHGPVTQGSHIAGLPLPPYSRDRSFGSVE